MPRGVPGNQLHTLDFSSRTSSQRGASQQLSQQLRLPVQLSQQLEDLRRSSRKRKEASVFESQPFQRSPAKRRRQNEDVRQITSTHYLEEGETDAEGDIDLDFDILPISKGRVSASASTVPPPTTSFTPRKIKQTKGRQLSQKITYGRRLTEEKDIILVNICIARSLGYGIESMRRF